MFMLSNRIFICLFFLVTCLAQTVLAQADPLDPLADDAPVAEEKKATAPAVKDPDAALKKAVDEKRQDTEKRLNRLQSAMQEYADIEEAVSAASTMFLNAMNQYYMEHSTALDAYQTADASGDQKATKKASAGQASEHATSFYRACPGATPLSV